MSLDLVTKVMLPGAKVLVSSVDLVTHCQLPLGQVKPGDVSIGITLELSESPVRQPSATPTGFAGHQDPVTIVWTRITIF